MEAAFAHADVVVEGEYAFPAVYQYALETHAVVARYEPDEITVWASCQHPFLVRAELAELFAVPLSRVRIIVPYLGGGFGSKSYTKMEPITVAIARKAGRPVRIQNRVDESMLTTRRHGMRCRMRTAATKDGRLLGREVELWLDTGAYADNGPRVTATAGDAAPGPYRWAAYRVEAACVYTNTSPSGSYRAFGATHVQWIGESQVDEIARRCGLDPLQLRRENLCTPGEELRAGGKSLDADLVGDVEKVAQAIGWGGPRALAGPRGLRRPPRGRRPSRLDGHRAARGGRHGRRAGRHDREGPGRTHRHGADRGRGARGSRSSEYGCRAPIRATRRTTARPEQAGRRRSRGSPYSGLRGTCTSSSPRSRAAGRIPATTWR